MKVFHINFLEFNQLWKILLEDIAPTAEVGLVVTLLDVALVVVVVDDDGLSATNYNTNLLNKKLFDLKLFDLSNGHLPNEINWIEFKIYTKNRYKSE